MNSVDFLSKLEKPMVVKSDMIELLTYFGKNEYMTLYHFYNKGRDTSEINEDDKNRLSINIINTIIKSINEYDGELNHDTSWFLSNLAKVTDVEDFLRIIKDAPTFKSLNDMNNYFVNMLRGNYYDVMLNIVNSLYKGYMFKSTIFNPKLDLAHDLSRFDLLKKEVFLTLNVQQRDLYFVADYIFNKVKDTNILYTITLDDKYKSDDSFKLRCDQESYMYFVDIILEMFNEYPDLKERIGHPGFLYGNYENLIGFTESMIYDSSYYFKDTINVDYKKWRKNFNKASYKVKDKRYSGLDYITYRLYEKFIREKVNFCIESVIDYKKTFLTNQSVLNEILKNIKTMVYSLEDYLKTGELGESKICQLPQIADERSYISSYEVYDELRNLYVDVAIRDSKRLDTLLKGYQEQLQSKDIANNGIMTIDSREDVVGFLSDRDEYRKVIASKKVEYKELMRQIIFHCKKIVDYILDNRDLDRDEYDRVINSKTKVLLKLYNNFVDKYKNGGIVIPTTRYNSYSEDEDELLYYYATNMMSALEKGHFDRVLELYELYKDNEIKLTK